MNGWLQDCVPPLVRRWLRPREWRCSWSGDHPSWEAAAALCTGYAESAILDRVGRAAMKVRVGEGAFERDSVVFENPEYSWPVLAVLMAAARADGRLWVLDFGGSLGSVYFQHRRWLEGVRNLRWWVVEQEHFVRRGREHFEDGRLRFRRSIAECLAEGRPGVVLLSSVLAYLPRPEQVLEELGAAGMPRIVIDRTGFTLDDSERITVQRVPPAIYDASYPCRFFSRSALIGRMEERYELVSAFPALDEAPPFAEYLGLYFESRRNGAPLSPPPKPHAPALRTL